jgi:hypothetical protein
VWRVPYCSATSFANGRSSMRWSAKPIEKLWSGSAEALAAEAVTRPLSIPPERNTPTGTSLLSLIRTDSSKTVLICSSASWRLPLNVPLAGRCQYRWSVCLPSASIWSQWAGGTALISLYAVFGCGTKPKQRYW